MDARLFAKIHLDTEIRASTLEGGDSSESAQFLLNMAQDFEETYKEEYKAELEPLKKSLGELLVKRLEDNKEQLQKIKEYYKQIQIPEEKQNDTPEKILESVLKYFYANISLPKLEQQILNLKKGENGEDGESLCLDGGYNGVAGKSGHAVLYRFKKNINGEIIIDVFNTGSGVNRHFDADSQPEGWYQTQASYKLIDAKNLREILQKLAIPLILPQLPTQNDDRNLKKIFEFNMNYVYDALEKNNLCSKIPKKDDHLISRSWLGQQSGSCSFRVFTPLLHDLLPDKILRDRFKVHYKFKSIKIFYQQIQENGTPQDWELLSSAIAKLIRIIEKKIEKNPKEKKKYKKILNELHSIGRDVNKIIKASKEPIIALTGIPNKKMKSSTLIKHDAFPYSKGINLQRPHDGESKEDDTAEDLSKKSMTQWIKSNTHKSKIDVEIFYSKMLEILQMKKYGAFEKRCAIEKMVRLIYEKYIQIDTSNINDPTKLMVFFQKTENLVEAFKGLSIQPNGHNIPTHLDTIQVAFTLAAITREASLHGLQKSALPAETPEQLYEKSVNSHGFIESSRTNRDLRKETYDKRHPPMSYKKATEFYKTMEDELLANTHFKKIYAVMQKEYNFSERKLLQLLIREEKNLTEKYPMVNKSDVDQFIEYLINTSLYGICTKRNHIIRKLKYLDYQMVIPRYDNYHSYIEEYGFQVSNIFECTSEKISPKEGAESISPWSALNRSQIATSEYADSMTTFPLLAKIASAGVKEENLLNEFIQHHGQEAENIAQALAFTTPRFAIYNILDYFSRHPEKLTDKYSQIIFMMSLFGRGKQDLPLLREENYFEHLRGILDYHLTLFSKDLDAAHGIFLLELFAAFNESEVYHPWLNNKYNTLLPIVLEVCESHRGFTKIALCTKIIHDIDQFNDKINLDEKTDETDNIKIVHSLCDIILLNKKQQDLSSDRNFRVFAKAGAHYFNLVSDHFHLLRENAEIAKEYIAKSLYPEMKENKINKITKSMLFEHFPEISMRVDGKKMVFNVTRGEIRYAEGIVQINVIPEDYITPAFGPQYNHSLFINTLQKCAGSSFVCQLTRGIGEYDSIETKLGEITFHFQKNDEGKPIIFMEKQFKIFEKIDASCIEYPELNTLFSDNPNYSIWRNWSGDFIVLDENLKEAFQGSGLASYQNYEDIIIDKIDGKDPSTIQRLILTENYRDDKKISKIAEHVSHFTGSDFRIYKAFDDKLTIDIPGYQISFTENNEGELIFSGNSNLILETNERLNFPGSITLFDRVNQKRHILIPNLPFIDTEEQEGYFKKYLPDYSLKSYNSLSKNNEGKFKQYAKQRTFFKFEVNEKTGEPNPNTAEEKLFLCYYYMNTKEYDKAFALIKNFPKKEIAEARFPIMELLYRIICESPKITMEEQKTHFNDKILATKIQALLIVAAHIKVGKKIQWPEKAQNFISFATIKSTKSFFDKFPNSDCHELVDIYIKNVSSAVFPETLRVNNAELGILSAFSRAKNHENNKKMYEWNTPSPSEQESSSWTIRAKAWRLSHDLSNVINDGDKFASSPVCQKKPAPKLPVPDEKYLFDADPKITLAQKIILQEREDKKALIAQAKTLFEDKKKIRKLGESIQKNIQSLEKISDAKEKLLQLCHEIQKDNPSILLAIESADKDWMTFEDLVVAFLRNDYSQIAKNLGVSIDDPVINKITKITRKTMQADIQLHRLLEVEKTMEKYQKEPSDDNALLFMTALTQQSSEYVLTEKNRELLIFEYYEKKRLRKNQVDSIEYVLLKENENSCVQFIMGGGKTSVFLPLAAMKNANGVALSVVIVPESSLAVNEKQLDVKTMQLFSSKSQTLHFDRDSPSTPDDLYRILKTLEKTRDQQGYLVTSKETLQAIELKYIELLGKKYNETNAQCLDILEDILLIFRKEGKSIIDEVDSVLHIGKEFNYSNGIESPIEPVLIRDTMYLYTIMETLPKQKITKENVHLIMEALLDRMLEDKNSFISDLVKRFSQSTIKGYLLGKNVSTEFMWNLTADEKDRIAFIKHQLTALLPSTLLQELNVTYGPSKARSGTFSAIPYLCNNTPSESSRFSSPYETLNLTIQMHRASPIHPLLFEKMLHHFRVKNFNEIISSASEITLASQEFSELTGLDLDFVCEQLKKTGNLKSTLSLIEKNPETAFRVKCYLIEYGIAAEITHFPEIIKSNTIDLVNQLRSTVCVSGTVQNYRTFHSRIQLAESLNSDTDGRTLFHLIEKNCKSEVHPEDKIYPGQAMREALEKMLTHPNTRAIMDIGALFTGMNNLDVAKCLAEIIQEKQWDIQYVIFFDANNQPCAFSLKDGSITPLQDTNEDYLKIKLNCEPSQRFTFYDQINTTGSDIKQMANAHAVATIGEKTRQRDLLQGVMRMRQFAENQTVEFLVSKGAAEGRKIDVMGIIQFVKKNEEEELQEDHYRAACKKITACVRNHFMEILLYEIKQISDPQKRYQVREKASQIFNNRLRMKTPGPYEQYGQIVTLEETEIVLRNRMKIEADICRQNIRELNNFLLADHIDLIISEDLSSLKKTMKKIVDDALPPVCKKQVISPVSSISEQVEVQAQQQTQEQTQELQQLFDESHKAKDYIDSDIQIPLQSFCPAFENNIFVTENLVT